MLACKVVTWPRHIPTLFNTYITPDMQSSALTKLFTTEALIVLICFVLELNSSQENQQLKSWTMIQPVNPRDNYLKGIKIKTWVNYFGILNWANIYSQKILQSPDLNLLLLSFSATFSVPIRITKTQSHSPMYQI